MVLFVDTRLSAETQKINDTVSHSAVAKRIRRHIVASSDFLIEKLVNDLAQVILTEFAVERVILRAGKAESRGRCPCRRRRIDRTGTRSIELWDADFQD